MAKMRFLFFFLFFSSLSFTTCYAQVITSFNDDDRIYIAKLEKEIQETNSDSIKAYNSLRLSVMYNLVNDTLKANDYLLRGVALSEKNLFLKSVSYYYRARALYSKRDIQGIEYNLMKGDSLLKQFDNEEAYRVRTSIWYHYSALQQTGDRENEALNILLNKAMPNAQKSNDLSLLGQINMGIASILIDSEQYKKAQNYLAQTTYYLEKLPMDAPHRTAKLITAFIMSAENYIAREIYDSAKVSLDRAKAILMVKPVSTNIHSDYYLTEGIYFSKIKNYTEAIRSFDEGISKAQSPLVLNRLKYAKCQALQNNGSYENALVLLMDLLRSPIILSADKKNFYKDLYTTHAKLGNIEKAYTWSLKYITLSDSLYEAKYQNDIVELEAKYSKVENETKIAALQSANERAELTSKSNRLLAMLLGTISFFLLISGAFGWMYYRDNKKLSEQKEVNYQQKLKEAEQQQQMQYAKALLQGEEKERKRMAGDLHDGLGGMLARVKINLSKLAIHNHEPTMTPDLNKVIDQLDNSVNELRRIARNMMPESLISLGLEAALTDMCASLTSDTTYVNFQAFDISHAIAKDTQSAIYRIVQELLTNAIRHAKASQIVVQCSQNENTFFITVEDNGIGFDAKETQFKNGIGLANVKSRVDYLGGKLDIASTPGDGTTINIELNVVA